MASLNTCYESKQNMRGKRQKYSRNRSQSADTKGKKQFPPNNEGYKEHGISRGK